MANVIGVELRAMFVLGDNQNSIDCWGPVVRARRGLRRAAQGFAHEPAALG